MARAFIHTILSIFLLAVCTLLSWHTLSKLNFFFDHVYEYNEIADHIDQYAPKNVNRNDFEVTTKEERIRLFGEMVTAVNSDGSGLSDIYYKAPSDEKIDTFLTEPELNHLIDVSELVSYSNEIGVTVAICLVVIYSLLYICKSSNTKPFWKPISMPIILINTSLFTIIGTLGIFMIGPHNVFLYLHEVMFSDKAQWDFFFEESLMTTLLPVPVFGSMAIMLVVVAILWWMFFSVLIGELLN